MFLGVLVADVLVIDETLVTLQKWKQFPAQNDIQPFTGKLLSSPQLLLVRLVCPCFQQSDGLCWQFSGEYVSGLSAFPLLSSEVQRMGLCKNSC